MKPDLRSGGGAGTEAGRGAGPVVFPPPAGDLAGSGVPVSDLPAGALAGFAEPEGAVSAFAEDAVSGLVVSFVLPDVAGLPGEVAAGFADSVAAGLSSFAPPVFAPSEAVPLLTGFPGVSAITTASSTLPSAAFAGAGFVAGLVSGLSDVLSPGLAAEEAAPDGFDVPAAFDLALFSGPALSPAVASFTSSGFGFPLVAFLSCPGRDFPAPPPVDLGLPVFANVFSPHESCRCPIDGRSGRT